MLKPVEIVLNDTQGYAFGYEIDLRELIKEVSPLEFVNIPLSPPTKQDLSFIIDSDILAEDVVKTIYTNGGEWLTQVRFIDQYQSKEMISTKKKSLTFRLIFEYPQRSLSDTEVNEIKEKIEKNLTIKYKAQIR